MPRHAGLRPALLALALSLPPLGACSSHGGADAGAVAEMLAPLPAPAGHLGDLVLAAPGATWTKARGTVGQPALFLPQSFGGLVATLVGVPITLSAEIDEAVPVVGSAARQGRGPLQVAVGIHVKAGDRFLDQLTRGDGARFNATLDPATHVTLLTDKITPESAGLALGVLGNYLLVGRKPSDLYALGPYVVRTLGPAPASNARGDLAVEMPEQALAGPILDAVRELRGRSEGAVATVVPLAGMLDAATTLLGDASRARLSVSFDGVALHGRFTVTPKPGGAGSKLVADLPVGDVKPLLELPGGTTLGLLWRESAAARGENAIKQAGALSRMLGSETSDDDKAAITAALRAEAEARGDWQAVGVTLNSTAPTAVVRAPVSDAEAMRKALKQLVDLGAMASFKKALGGLGIKLTSDKAVVDGLAEDVTRVRLARAGDEPQPSPAKKETKAKKPGPDPADGPTPKAIDLLYFVGGAGLFAAAGFDPRESLRALVKAPSGSDLAASPPVASALAAVGADATFVLVADARSFSVMTGGSAPPATPAPLVIAAGRSSAPAELWGRVDLPNAAMQQLVEEYTRRRASPPAASP